MENTCFPISNNKCNIKKENEEFMKGYPLCYIFNANCFDALHFMVNLHVLLLCSF